MNKKRYVIASLVVFVAACILDYIIHCVILCGTYKNYPEFFVTDIGAGGTILTIIGALVFGFIFCFIFTKGYEERGILEGVRYGLWIGLLLYLPCMLYSWAVFKFPIGLPVWWLILGVIEMIILGIIAAVIYKPAEAKVEELKPEEPRQE